MRNHILVVVGIVIIIIIGILATQKVIQQENILKEENDKVVQYCLDRGYLTYSFTSYNGTTHRFCLSSDGVLHVLNLTPNLVDDE